MAAAAAPAAASTAGHGRRHRAELAGPGFAAAGDSCKHGNGTTSWLLAYRTIGAAGVHGLEFIELIFAGRAVVFVQRHNIPLN